MTQHTPLRALIACLMLAVVLVGCDDASVAPLPTRPSTLPEMPTVPVVTQAPAVPTPTTPPRSPLLQGWGAQKGFWQVFFTAPTGSRDATTYVNGIDGQLADAIYTAQRTLDIAAFEFNNVVLTQAVLDAHARGVVVRMVVDDVHGANGTNSSIPQFVAAGIPVVNDGRAALMHNKFMIIDSTMLWTGSYNYSINDTYRNNNNMMSFRSQKLVQDFQNEFNKMFELRQFGASKTANTPVSSFTQNGVPIQVLFAPKDRVVAAMAVALSGAQQSIQFMAFSFTLDDIAGIMQQKAAQGVVIQGVFETTGSETRTSELRPLFCSGLDVRQDGNPFVMHHKVFIIDGKTVIMGSFNFSTSARDDNDENLIIITDPDLALQYQDEFNRRWNEARVPTRLTCN
ncbi:MAG: phospholipase [Anaerolineae bacterium]|nr:phospholipase [Anaerolineae bacterium]